MKSNTDDKSYIRSINKYENFADVKPDKKIRKYKRRDRQKAKKEIERDKHKADLEGTERDSGRSKTR